METQNNNSSLRKFLNNLFTISFSCTTKKTTTDVAVDISAIVEDSNPVSEAPKVDETIVVENEVIEIVEVISESINIETEVTETSVIEK